MRYIITESQYKFLIEQDSRDNWLYNWFRNAPEEKIKNTFSFFSTNPFESFLYNPNNIGRRIPKPNYYKKREILDLLSKKPPINTLDKKTFDFIIGDTNTGGLYIEGEFKDKVDEYISFIDKMENDLNKYQQTPEITSRLKEMEQMRKKIQMFATYAGTIIVPDDMKERIKSWGLGGKEIIRHEEMHGLYDNTLNSADNIIKSLCRSSKCNKEELSSITKNTEVYSYLMTIRSKFNMQPTDIIKSVKVTDVGNSTELTLTIDRNGKIITSKDVLPKNSAVLKAMECCTGNIANSIQILHNTLAKNDDNEKSSNLA